MANKTTIMVSSSLRTIGTMTVITSLLWTAFGVYNALTKPPSLDIPAAILAPVTATIDKDTLEKLKDRRQLTDEVNSDEFVQQALQVMLIEPATGAATLSTNPVASPSATPMSETSSTTEASSGATTSPESQL